MRLAICVAEIPHPASRSVDQDPLALLQPSHHDQTRLGGRVVDRERGALLEGKLLGQLVDHVLPHCDQLGLAVEARAREHPSTQLDRLDPVSHRLHFARHLVADHAGHLRRVRIHPGSGKRVGKVDPRRLDRDTNLTRPHRRVGPLLDLEDLGPPVPGDHNRPHRARTLCESKTPRTLLSPPGAYSRRRPLVVGRASRRRRRLPAPREEEDRAAAALPR
jgi:hypothetical protein